MGCSIYYTAIFSVFSGISFSQSELLTVFAALLQYYMRNNANKSFEELFYPFDTDDEKPFLAKYEYNEEEDEENGIDQNERPLKRQKIETKVSITSEALPDEVWAMILSYLNVFDIVNMGSLNYRLFIITEGLDLIKSLPATHGVNPKYFLVAKETEAIQTEFLKQMLTELKQPFKLKSHRLTHLGTYKWWSKTIEQGSEPSDVDSERDIDEEDDDDKHEPCVKLETLTSRKICSDFEKFFKNIFKHDIEVTTEKESEFRLRIFQRYKMTC
jgi:hypothetical protein